MLKTAVVIRHVHFEDLGTFEAVLTAAGYRIYYYDLGMNELWTVDPAVPDLLVILGGPVGVYEARAYPFLEEERQLLETRLAARRPTLGICLGAQQIAAALGARVAPMGHKEIGFSPLRSPRTGGSARFGIWKAFPCCIGTETPSRSRRVRQALPRPHFAPPRASPSGRTSLDCSFTPRSMPAPVLSAG
jgi:GMP synthase-like glutamine amidotransferase